MLDNLDFSWENLSQNLPSGGKQKKWERDTRFWKIGKNEEGVGAAVIRLLPNIDGKPMIKMFHYSSKKGNPAGGKPLWLIANSPETIGQPCPIKEHYMNLIAEGTEEAKNQAKFFKRQTKFIANILVEKDPANPDNNGKVFLFEFGTKLRDKFYSWLQPSETELEMGETPKNLYNPLDGYSIKLKIKPQGDFSTYDGSEVMPAPTSLFDTKEEAVAFIKANCYDLNEFLKPEFYESYDELKARLDRFSGKSGAKGTKTQSPKEDFDTFDMDETPKPSVTSSASTKAIETAEDDSDSWLDDL